MFVKEYRLKSKAQGELRSGPEGKAEAPVEQMQSAQSLKIADLPPEIQAEVLSLVDQLNASKAMHGRPGEWKAGD